MRALLQYLKLIPILGLLFASCESKLPETADNSISKPDSTNVPGKQPYNSVNVYIAGAINVSNNKWNASYWKNSKEVVLSSEHSFAKDIVVYKGDVFVGGEMNGLPCYWINGKCNLISKEQGHVSAIRFHKGSLYLIGLYRDSSKDKYNAFLWKNDTFTILGNGYANASDIAFDKDDIYVAGTDEGKPCYWKNQLKVSLSNQSGHVYGIEVAGKEIYLAGEYRPDNGGYYLSGYWKNKEFISTAGNAAYIWNVGVNKEKVCLVGGQTLGKNLITDQAILIEDNVKMVLNVPDHVSASAMNIAFIQDQKYIIGTCVNSEKPELSSQVCYWFNNQFYIIGRPGSVCSSIFIEPDL